jgi:hypothetical protein
LLYFIVNSSKDSSILIVYCYQIAILQNNKFMIQWILKSIIRRYCMKKIHIKERDDHLLSEGLIITTNDNGKKKRVSILEEAFLTDLSDCCELEVKFVKQYWPPDIYTEDIELGYVYPTPFSKAVVYLEF